MMFDHRIGDTIRIENTWTTRRWGDGLPLTLPCIYLTLTPELVRRELARQRAWAKKKPLRKSRASVPRRSTR